MTSPLKTLVAYLEAFEQAYTSDNWSLIDPYFTADASYRVEGGPPFAGHWPTLEGIKIQFKKILDEFDRRFDQRIPELLGRPKLKGDAILFEWKATYKLAGAPDFVLVGKSTARMRDGQICELIDFIAPEDCLAGADYFVAVEGNAQALANSCGARNMSSNHCKMVCRHDAFSQNVDALSMAVRLNRGRGYSFMPVLFFSCTSWGNFWETQSSAKDLTAFALPVSALTGKIYSSTVTLYAESTTSLAAQAATFTTTGKSVKVNGVEQVSGVTQNNFSNPLTYTVTATDGSTRDYLIVVLAPRLVAGLSAWYKADALAYADGATIATWNDSSANANHLGLSYGIKPVMKTGIVNGKPVGRFTRVGTTDGIYSNTVTGFSGNSFTYFMVFRRTAYNAQEQYIFFVNDGSAGCSGTGLAQSIQAGAGGGLLVNRPCSSYYVTAGPDFTDTSAFHLLSMRYDST